MAGRQNTVTLEGVRTIPAFRNFAGKKTAFNNDGNRNFTVFLDTEEQIAKALDAGFNVRTLKPRPGDEELPPQHVLEVKLNYGGARPPKIVMLKSRGRENITEEQVNILDWVEIVDSKIDIILNPYHWTVGEKQGITAYLQNMYFTIVEDELDLKYAEEADSLSSRAYVDTPDPDYVGPAFS